MRARRRQDCPKWRQDGLRRCKTAQDGVKTAHDGPKRPNKSDRRVDYGDAQTVDGRAIAVVVFNLFHNVFSLSRRSQTVLPSLGERSERASEASEASGAM